MIENYLLFSKITPQTFDQYWSTLVFLYPIQNIADQTPTKKDSALFDAVLKLLPAQSKVSEYIRRQQAKKISPAWSRTDIMLGDLPTTFSRGAVSSKSVDNLSHRTSGVRSGTAGNLPLGRKFPKNHSDIFSDHLAK